uniref:Ig-like domain-containing protein n=1 Tax=Setaria digitata TaxID=48799 RepID=A0A915PW65_9BILA
MNKPEHIFVNDVDVTLPIVKVDEATLYVPMGRHIILNCEAWNSAQNNYDMETGLIKWIFRDIEDHRNGRIILYTAQKENEGIYDCHVGLSKRIEWVSRINLYVQDCDKVNDLTLYRNVMNPCRYGSCAIDNFPSAPLLKYLKCNCILQYTGEFCTELVDGAIGREILRFSPFIAHVFAILSIFIAFFCCKRTFVLERRKRIVSLEDVAPLPPNISDNPKVLYPTAMLPILKNDETITETDLNIRTIALCLEELKNK